MALRLAFAAVFFFAAGCAGPTVVGPQDSGAELVWPKPPALPRIQFLYTITGPRDINVTDGAFKKFIKFIKGAPARKGIARPYGIAKDKEGRLYVVDTFSKVVHVLDRENNDYYTFPDSQIENYINPIDVVAGEDGRIYVSDSAAKLIHVFAAHGKQYVKSFGAGHFERPTELAINSRTGELIVVDTAASSLVVYDENTLEVKQVVGKDSSGKEGFHYPTNITVSRQGLIYVTDALNFRVQVLNSKLEFLTNIGAAGNGPGYFSSPRGVAIDSDGHVYVVDALFDNVQVFDQAGRLLLVFGVSGSDRGEFWLPKGIFIDPQDRIYIADSYNHRVQVFQYLKSKVNQP